MRTLALTLVAAALIGCSSTPRTASTAPAQDNLAMTDINAPIDADAAVITVRGLSCPKCATGVDQQLAKIDGVDTVDVDFATGAIDVTFDALHQRPTRAQLAKAIEDSGFTLVSITPRR